MELMVFRYILVPFQQRVFTLNIHICTQILLSLGHRIIDELFQLVTYIGDNIWFSKPMDYSLYNHYIMYEISLS